MNIPARFALFLVPVLLFLLLFAASVSHAQEQNSDVMKIQEALEGVPEKYKPLFGPALYGEAAQRFREGLTVVSISMSRSGCLGKCPVYDITLNIDESAEYEGKYFVEKTGEFSGKVSLRTFGKLCYLIDTMGFEDFDSRYAAPWTDDSGFTVKLVYRDGSTKSVHSYGGFGPIELWALSRTIDSIAERIEWQ